MLRRNTILERPRRLLALGGQGLGCFGGTAFLARLINSIHLAARCLSWVRRRRRRRRCYAHLWFVRFRRPQ